ncbi:MAG: hypothetical protein AAF720_00795 [Pseudomonadota bacterium]
MGAGRSKSGPLASTKAKAKRCGDLYASGLSLRQVAEQEDISHERVRQLLILIGIKLRSAHQGRTVRFSDPSYIRRRTIVNAQVLDRERRVMALFEAGHLMSQIGKRLKMSKGAVSGLIYRARKRVAA